MRLSKLLESNSVKKVALELQQFLLDHPMIDLDVKLHMIGNNCQVYAYDQGPLKMVNYVFRVNEPDEDYFDSKGHPFINGLGTATPGAPQHHLIPPFTIDKLSSRDEAKEIYEYLLVIETLNRLRLAGVNCTWISDPFMININWSDNHALVPRDRLTWDASEHVWVTSSKQKISTVAELIEFGKANAEE